MSRNRPFRLIRFFSLASLAGIVAVTAGLLWVYGELSTRQLVEHETRANADLTRSLANMVWNKYRDYVIESDSMTPAAMRADPRLADLNEDVSAQISGLRLTAFQVYNLRGTIVYSTDAGQVGIDRQDHRLIRAAAAGEVQSFVTRRPGPAGRGSAVVDSRDLLVAYLPLYGEIGGAIDGVVEVFSDVTEMLAEQRRASWHAAGILMGALSLLYGFLYLIVRKAERIIGAQEDERRAREEQIRHQAYHDALTGLPNRMYFAERVEEAISHAQRHDETLGLMFIDLDRFKIVNDSLGHDAGDALLVEVGRRLKDSLRKSDVLFRMGGDEFTVILPKIRDPEDAALVARRILAELSKPIRIHDHDIVAGASVGIAVCPGDGDRAETLVKHADAAMYEAKAGGRGRYTFFREEMNQRACARLEIEEALQRGFRNGELEVFYQPRHDAHSRRIVSLEALLRWRSPERGLVPPNEFIPVLEDIGMMVIVGEWVLRTVCAQMVAWQAAGIAPVRASVNVASTQFLSPSFVETVERVLQETGLPASCLELEVTESLLTADAEDASATLRALRELGVSISVDDFGTGRSTLNYLRNCPIDFLKIDRSFVGEVASNPRDQAIAVAIAGLAKTLDITVVAEGIENESQARFFERASCGELQGYLFGRPMPVAEVQGLLAAAVQGAAVESA